jgi:hypothetical protein
MQKIQVNLIFEILGRPPEHIKEALNTLVIKMGSEKGVKILSKQYHEPKKVEDPKANDLYTAFAEVTLELDSMGDYFKIIFTYMPANIELVSPESISFNNFELNELSNALLQRLHNYDAITKNVVFERDMFAKKLQEVAPHLFRQPEQTQQPAKNVKKESKSNAKKAKTNKKKKK